MFTINKDKFFNILTDINKSCVYKNVKDCYFMEIPKFNNMMNYIDMNEFNVDYVQNRLITIKRKDIDLKFIKNLIICPIDTKGNLINEQCENISYNFPTVKRNSFLTQQDNEINESYCIKGYMTPGILNAILVYMINNGYMNNDTMIIFSLKSNNSRFDGDDIIEYLQKYLKIYQNSITNIINLDYTSLERAFPKKDYCEKIIVESIYPTYSNEFMKRALNIENLNFRKGINFDLDVKPLPAVLDNYRKILQYFQAMNYIDFRLFIFSDKPVIAKYHNLVDIEYLVEWNSIEKMINHLYDIIKRGEN